MKIKNGFYMTEIGTDFVVIASSPEAKNIFSGMLRLNETGAFLWKKLIDGADEEQLAAAVSEEYGVSREIAANDTAEFLATVRSAGFIEE